MQDSGRWQFAWTAASIVLGATTFGCPRHGAEPEPLPVVVYPVESGKADVDARSEHVLRLVYQVDPSAGNPAARALLAPKVGHALRRRLEALGIRGAVVEAQGDRVEVRLPRLSDEDFGTAKAILSKRARFEFRMVDDEQDFVGKAVGTRGTWDGSGGVELQQEHVSAGQGRSAMTHYLSATRRPGESTSDALRRLREAVKGLPKPASGTEVGYGRTGSQGMSEGWRTYVLFERAELGNEHIEEAEAQRDRFSGGWNVAIRFTDEGASSFERLTASNIKRRLAIVLDGVVESAPVIMSPIAGGKAVITMGGGNPDEAGKEARQLELTLRAGALPAPVLLLIEDTIPPR